MLAGGSEDPDSDGETPHYGMTHPAGGWTPADQMQRLRGGDQVSKDVAAFDKRATEVAIKYAAMSRKNNSEMKAELVSLEVTKQILLAREIIKNGELVPGNLTGALNEIVSVINDDRCETEADDKITLRKRLKTMQNNVDENFEKKISKVLRSLRSQN